MASTTSRPRLRTALAALGAALLAPTLLAGPASASPAAQEEKQPFGGNVSYAWEIPDAPKGGMTSLTMPMTIHGGSEHIDGTYVATQYAFTEQDEVGYMGLQPRADSTNGCTACSRASSPGPPPGTRTAPTAPTAAPESAARTTSRPSPAAPTTSR